MNPDDRDRILWLAVRRALLAVVKAIEIRFDLHDADPETGKSLTLRHGAR